MTAGRLPDQFVYELEDGAMGRFGGRGTRVIFDSTLRPQIGSGVLVKTGVGELHVRRMRQGRSASHWIAAAPNTDYRDLDSEADGLTVLGVWFGLLGKGLEDA